MIYKDLFNSYIKLKFVFYRWIFQFINYNLAIISCHKYINFIVFKYHSAF